MKKAEGPNRDRGGVRGGMLWGLWWRGELLRTSWRENLRSKEKKMKELKWCGDELNRWIIDPKLREAVGLP